MFYTVYKITNNLDGKYYIGKHQTKDLNDGYFGSGKLLKRAIKKHGKENFNKEILFVFDNEQEMNDKEKELVILEESSYNLCEGGKGGWSYIHKHCLQLKTAGKNLKKATPKFLELLQCEEWKNCWKQKISDGQKQYYLTNINSFKGKKHSEETKKKIGLLNSKHQVGEKNSQYGTKWITNGSKNRKIYNTDNIPEGWSLGRVCV